MKTSPHLTRGSGWRRDGLSDENNAGKGKLITAIMGGDTVGDELMNMVAHERGLCATGERETLSPGFRCGSPGGLETWTHFGPSCPPETCPGTGGGLLVPLTGCVSGCGIQPGGTAGESGSGTGNGRRHLRRRASG